MSFEFDALDEVLSLADPYQAEPTSLANPCQPVATRRVEVVASMKEINASEKIGPSARLDTNQNKWHCCRSSGTRGNWITATHTSRLNLHISASKPAHR